jgi:asparagine synthase (glutamine-hydrolysing)
MPLAHAAVLAVNSMEGIAYETPPAIKREIEEALSRHVEALASTCDERTQLSFLDLVHVCAGIYAAKSFDPIRAKGLTPWYPFLQTRVLARALSLEWGDKCPSGESKGMLKTLLAEEVPGGMVYRPKSGFLPPFREVLAHPSMQEFLRSELLSDQSPLSGFGKRAMLVAILDRGAGRKSLSLGAQNLIWALAFTSAWYRRNASPARDKL